ncbi:Yip1 family protein [Sporosarcina thermotolerans]|uniref:Yip1 family protein n=1 Tax=Sporosarcina thermotolerans TaxID=633404 RepID=A0AAW9A871_9BACL|nr:Yip1 family protein [Sporosarcina thermotolerans]MDW0117239.1 Yip1 family protein [Sporosarcina thermotolerans]WHT47409.1 Yip1 family protein [Sporosarcina thermotolerans]
MLNIEDEKNVEPKLNPWTSVWLHPRKTVQYVSEYKPESFIIMIAVLAGLVHFLDQAMSNDLGDIWSLGTILLVSLIAGPLLGILGLYVASGLYHMISRMFRGSGTFSQTKSAYAVSGIILVLGGLIWIPDLIILGQGNFMSDYDFTLGHFAWLFISLLGNLTIGGWSLVALIAAISEVHRFSIGKAILVVVLPIIILVVIIIIIIALTLPFF